MVVLPLGPTKIGAPVSARAIVADVRIINPVKVIEILNIFVVIKFRISSVIIQYPRQTAKDTKKIRPDLIGTDFKIL